jgi:hypothetical protein
MYYLEFAKYLPSHHWFYCSLFLSDICYLNDNHSDNDRWIFCYFFTNSSTSHSAAAEPVTAETRQIVLKGRRKGGLARRTRTPEQ